MLKTTTSQQPNDSIWLGNPLTPRQFTRKHSKACDDCDVHKYIYSRELKDVYERKGEDKHEYVVTREVVEVSKIDRQEYIDSFANDVGILNILKKVEMTNDLSLLNERVRTTLPVDQDGYEQTVDITGINSTEDVRTYLGNMNKILNSMPADVKEAVINMDGEQLKAFLEGLESKNNEVKNNE